MILIAYINKRLSSFVFLLILTNIYGYAQKQQFRDSLKGEIAKSTSTTKKVDALNALSKTYRYTYPDSTLHFVAHTLRLSQEANYIKGTSAALINKGFYFFLEKKYDQAMTNFDSALELAKRIDDKALIMESYNLIAGCYYGLDDYFNCISSLEKAIDIAYDVDDLSQVNIFLSNLAIIYGELEEYDMAIEHLLKAEKQLMDNVKDLEPRSKSMITQNIYASLANIYNEIDNYEAAKYYANKLIDYANDSDKTVFPSRAYTALGSIYKKSDSLDKAQHNFNIALKLFKEETNKSTKMYNIIALLNSAKIHLIRKELDSAYMKAHLGYQMSTEFNDIKSIFKGSELLYKIHVANGQPKKAIEYGEIALKYNDSVKKLVNSKVSYAKLIALEKRAAQEKNASELRIKQLEHRRTIFILFGIFGVLLSSLLIYKNYKLKTERNNAEFNLQQKIKLEKKIKHIESSIASDLHDNFGNRLSGLITSFDIVKRELSDRATKNDFVSGKHLLNLKTNFEALIEDVKDLLWATNPLNNSINSLLEKITTTIENLNTKSNKQINFKSNYDKDYQLPNFANKQILFALKEIINNFIKYANIDFLDIHMELDNDTIKILARDKGDGFDIEQLNRVNGLNHVKKRMASINLSTSIISEKNKGVEILISGKL